MFENLTDKLSGIFEGLTKRGALREADVDAALREVRVALLDADVALPVARDFIAKVRERAVGADVLKSVTPGQMVVKIVHDELGATLGGGENAAAAEINLAGNPPVAILMVGLQGSGKTTTSAKLGLRLTNRDKKKVLLASLDVYRPAAQQQLATLGQQTGVTCLQSVLGEQPVAIAKRAMQTARLEAYDVVILDTAGRLHIDTELMGEVAQVRDAAQPTETLLVADAMTGQDSVNLAREFNEKIGITGLVLTRVDGDARGGAALSMRAVTGCPVKLMGTGETTDALETFNAERIAGSILGMGDIVGLVEKAQQVVEEEDAERMARKMLKGQFTLEDMAEQLAQIKKMGSLEGLLGMMPGAQKVKSQMADANIDDKMIARQEAIILSMTVKERQNPKIIKASRRKRIAAGSGTTVQEVNKLLKQHLQISSMMKKAGKMGKRGLMGALGGMGGGAMPPMPGGPRFG
ncbi:MAG: signal recognition particle protein [Rhodospirillaceae bacterium]